MLPEISLELDALRSLHLHRTLKCVAGPAGPHAVVDNRPCILFCSNNYLGLANHPRLRRAASEAIGRFGVSSTASRLVSGNQPPHISAERALADFLHAEATLSFPSGYAANLGAVTALIGPEDAIFSDRLNHRSLIDACRLSRAKTFVYSHADADDLDRQLRVHTEYRRRMILTDAVFSMDGDLAPLPGLVDLAQQHQAILMVDDAHGTAALGHGGRGTPEHFGIKGGIDILMTSGSKGLGTFGGYIAGSSDLVELLINRSAGFIYTTSLPPDVCAATEEALSVIADEPERLSRLRDRVVATRSGLKSLGFDTGASTTHIIPVIIGEADRAMGIADHLFERGLFVTAIRPPTVPDGQSRLRVALSADHTPDDIDRLLESLVHAARQFG